MCHHFNFTKMQTAAVAGAGMQGNRNLNIDMKGKKRKK